MLSAHIDGRQALVRLAVFGTDERFRGTPVVHAVSWPRVLTVDRRQFRTATVVNPRKIVVAGGGGFLL